MISKMGPTCKIKLYKGKANFVPSLELGFKDFLLLRRKLVAVAVAISETEFNRWEIRSESILFVSSIVALARSTMVLVPVQNAGGNLDQPIGRTKGIAIDYLCPFLVGNRTLKWSKLSGFRFIQ